MLDFDEPYLELLFLDCGYLLVVTYVDAEQHIKVVFRWLEVTRHDVRDALREKVSNEEVIGQIVGVLPPDRSEYLIDAMPGCHKVFVHPVTKKTLMLKYILFNLNDDQKWSFDQIADWIETLDEVPYFEEKQGGTDAVEVMVNAARLSTS